MNDFAHLLDRLAYEPRRTAKLRLLQDYFSRAPDPERGTALAAMTGALTFREAKPTLIRGLVEARVDPVLFRMSYHYVGDLAETTALIWPAPAAPEPGGIGHNAPPPQVPSLSEVVEALATIGKAELPARIAAWLDVLDETGRWALIKLITGELRVGVSARLAKTAVASLGGVEPDAVEEVWHGLKPPYLPLFAWVEGRAERPESLDPAPFRPPMLSHPVDEETDFARLDPAAFAAEWKWDGIRVQLVGGRDRAGTAVARIYSRTGEDISAAFPDLAEAIRFEGALDGELLILREGRVQSFNVLQQRLNRKAVTGRLLQDFPAHVRAYDLLALDGEDLRPLPFGARRARLEAFVAGLDHGRIDLSPLVPFADWEALAAARADPAQAGAGEDADAIEGVMLKRRDSLYVPGRPKGPWWKWKREPYLVDAVMMYAQRGHGKRSSFYSDYTFGVWRDSPEGGEELVPVGKAYHGFTDEELAKLDRYVRNHTVKRFGPVREVEYGPRQGLVLEIAFEGLQRSTRHKSGVAMRFPRVNRIRWDKPPAEADRIETLERILERGEREVMPGREMAR
ncbi:ATP dependent DNA ligase [Methylobacterium sp. 4-46]|uniref:cisplatin damage response ATP-dependent DNA ligase n=1 Tax=unclassified Methylobacterium TaxID=2615210 RepID=UPI000165C5CA|nr:MULTISPECIES: cisplatin damage response ATP-dependent DNA ligase [Methylobacterium]ACA15189.1 ATP dependent DNA ligase [Methylobacterium sp. 4-46]WFT80920.1 cisplatin damage response ATP-dependent DNA ligase [Methylobacterium nodulans]